ncbi:MAG: YifB family Mg chelatase-like AAA ATPase [Lachnospiraceae bacterium]|nr:YifB family Mg chelatase-like AAA ATPase [Lachnospiraceae bacterium]
MYSTVYSGALLGISAYMVEVEVDVSNGIPSFSMVGMLGTEVRESRERVCVALKNTGIQIPPMKITVNLSPADKRKEGTAFDLPIAVALMESLEFFEKGASKGILFLGELGLNGEIRPVKGVLPIIKSAVEYGFKECVVPCENALEAAVIPGIKVRGIKGVKELLGFLSVSVEKRDELFPQVKADMRDFFEDANMKDQPDFEDVYGQESAKRAAEIAAAGFHNILMVGPPGAGKSMIARRIAGIMPPLSIDESLEASSVASVAGLIDPKEPLIKIRPFMSPHHTITTQALTGGGSGMPRPGLISLAHRGVLFLDELPEFGRNTLDCLRQPLEEKKIHISRVAGNITYPADFMLVCAMNPCPCGYYPDLNRCKCTDNMVKKYMGRVSGPVLDRIDLCVELHPVEIGKMQDEKKGESSLVIRERILRARHIQKERFSGLPISFNGDMTSKEIDRFCKLGKKEMELMEQLYKNLKLSARAYHRILKVSRTIADLDESKEILEKHILEAACMRIGGEENGIF